MFLSYPFPSSYELDELSDADRELTDTDEAERLDALMETLDALDADRELAERLLAERVLELLDADELLELDAELESVSSPTIASLNVAAVVALVLCIRSVLLDDTMYPVASGR